MTDFEGMRRPRVALYSHDTVGLGHVRRNQLIAKSLAAAPLHASVLLITGVRQGGGFAVPEGIDSLILPAYRKRPDGSYGARSLDLAIGELIQLRSELIDTALLRFGPDILIVDNVPAGACGELLPALRRLKRQGITRCILGLRDILDDPAAIRREWMRRDNFTTIRDCYDEVWIYGDQAVYDTLARYDFPAEIRRKSTYVGYLDPRAGSVDDVHGPGARDGDRLILCVVGGGEDGFQLARNFASADFGPNTQGVLVTGPLMASANRQVLDTLANARADLRLIEALYDPLPLIRRADAVIGMAGYNSVLETVALGKRTLLVPRTRPRSEQLIRAQRMAELGLADTLLEQDATSEAISRWIQAPARAPSSQPLDFAGLQKVVQRTAELIGRNPAETRVQQRVASCG